MTVITRKGLDDIRRQLERDGTLKVNGAPRFYPTRARRVGVYMDIADGGTPPNSQQRRRESKRPPRRQGHPATSTSRERRKHWHDKPDEREQAIRELNRLARKYLNKMKEEDGEVAGLIAAVAEFVVPQLLVDFDLVEAEHSYPLQHWMMAKMGDVLREPDIGGYLEWRIRCLEEVRQ